MPIPNSGTIDGHLKSVADVPYGTVLHPMVHYPAWMSRETVRDDIVPIIVRAIVAGMRR